MLLLRARAPASTAFSTTNLPAFSTTNYCCVPTAACLLLRAYCCVPTAACLLLRAYSCRGLCMYARTDCRERHARRRQAQRCSSSATPLCLSPCRMVGTHGLSGRNILGFRHAKGEQLRRRRHAPRRRHVLERDPVFVPQHFLHLISRQAHFTHRHTHARRETRAKTTT